MFKERAQKKMSIREKDLERWFFSLLWRLLLLLVSFPILYARKAHAKYFVCPGILYLFKRKTKKDGIKKRNLYDDDDDVFKSKYSLVYFQHKYAGNPEIWILLKLYNFIYLIIKKKVFKFNYFYILH